MRAAIIFAIALTALSCGGSGGGATPTTDSTMGHCITIKALSKQLDFAGEDVPLDCGYVREAIEREMLTTSCMHTSTMLALRRATRYFPVIEPILKEHGLPDDFKYLAVAESGLNENAVSPAKAAGLWQFLSSAAKEYDLEVNNTVDERYHLEKATHAACEYLNKAYEQFGSWSLAAAAYNAGRRGVERRLEVQGVGEYWNLFLPEETMRYVPRILSFKILMNDTKLYGFEIPKSSQFQPFENYDIVKVNSRNIVWSDLAAEHGTTYRELRILNPWIRDYEHRNVSRKEYEVKMPNKKLRKFGY